ncbi:hypothetical protein [Spirillospora sp. NBC_01491]|uniref:hypothetical protein n=1 Tax=Spirillospora sp. NBC_01491 TaxID=2976007 RepID=UPI002E2F83C5|nr:hypothetical protein [Spirillospora sp. NBC_01491]
MAKQAVNGWFAELVSSAAKPIFGLLRATVLGTPEIDSQDMARTRQLWGTSQTIANTCYVLVISVAGVLLMAGQSLPGGEMSPRQLLVRLVTAFLASNLSLIFIGYGIEFANGLAGAFLNSGAEKIDPSVVADAYVGYVTATLLPTQPFMAILGLGVVALALCVAFIYVVRIAITMVLIAAAPLALMFHALPVTDGLARLWWRAITGILAIQVCQSLVLVTAFQLMFSETKDTSNSYFGFPTRNDITDLLLAICLLWVMVRIPSWVARTIWQPAQPRMLGQMLKSFLIYRGLGALMGKAGKAVQRPPKGVRPLPRTPLRPLPQPPPAPPPPPLAPPTPPPPPQQPPDAGQPVQLALPIPAPPRPAARRPVQLALPIPITRVPRPAATSAPATPPRPRVRSGQLMLPGMPKRPVPPRQLTLWVEPPKTRKPRRNP